MTYEDVLQVQHLLYLYLDHARLASPRRDIATVESQLHLVCQIAAAHLCSTPAIVKEIETHPEFDNVAAMIEGEARQREAIASRKAMEAEARAMMGEADAVTAKLRLVK